MERLAWVEILDRHSDVSVRHPVHAWPLKVGRAYISDIVLDDPYVAAEHLEIYPDDTGLYRVRVVNSNNGMTIGSARRRQSEAAIPADQTVRIGQTRFRIRPLNYAVSPEKPLPANAWSRSWPALIAASGVLVLASLLSGWLNYDRADSYNILFTPVIGVLVVLLLWSGFWALIGRVLSGSANFIAHAVSACLAVALLVVLDGLLYGYVDFALDTNVLTGMVSGIVGMLIIGTLLYRHIRLVSRIGRRKLGIILALLLAGLAGFAHLSETWNADEHLTDMAFSGALGPPFLSLAHAKSAESFIAGAALLQTSVDKARAAAGANADETKPDAGKVVKQAQQETRSVNALGNHINLKETRE